MRKKWPKNGYFKPFLVYKKFWVEYSTGVEYSDRSQKFFGIRNMFFYKTSFTECEYDS